ncbi:MAG: TCR/Tet family MFS transporter [Pseudomonadota bacterium]
MQAPATNTQSRSHSSLLFVAFIVFVDMTGLGLIVPIMPSLIQDLSGASIAQAAEIGGWLLFSYAMMQFLFAPVIGGLSDRYGRRPVLLITLAILGLDYAIMAWAPTLTWLFIGRIISGVMGASWTAANSCVADVVSDEERAKYFGILGGAGAAGFVLGPAIGGILGEFGDRLPFMVSSGMALGGAVVGYFLLRETLPVEKRRRFSLARANPLGSAIQISKTPLALGFLLVIFMLQLAAQSQIAIWAYYLIERFQWSELEIGLSVALFGLLLAIVQGGLTGPVSARYGNAKTGFWSLVFAIPSYLLFALAPAGWVMILGIFVGAASAFVFPAMQAMMSARIEEDAQGELQGAIASVIGLTSIFGPVLMTVTFRVFADGAGLYFPGAPYILAMVLCVVAVLLFARTVRLYHHW